MDLFGLRMREQGESDTHRVLVLSREEQRISHYKTVRFRKVLTMRIALLVPWLEIGGVETFVFRLSRIFQKNGHDVEIVATHSQGGVVRARSRTGNSRCLFY